MARRACRANRKSKSSRICSFSRVRPVSITLSSHPKDDLCLLICTSCNSYRCKSSFVAGDFSPTAKADVSCVCEQTVAAGGGRYSDVLPPNPVTTQPEADATVRSICFPSCLKHRWQKLSVSHDCVFPSPE